MRVKLAKHTGIFKKYRAVIGAYGKQKAWSMKGQRTILFKNVYHVLSNTEVSDHLWYTDKNSRITYPINTLIEFEGLASPYLKGVTSKYLDVCFIEIQNIRRVEL